MGTIPNHWWHQWSELLTLLLLPQMREKGSAPQADLGDLFGRILGGLRQLCVFSQTGGGQAALRAHTGARELVRSAMKNHREVASPEQQAALQGLVQTSKVPPVCLLASLDSSIQVKLCSREAQRLLQVHHKLS